MGLRRSTPIGSNRRESTQIRPNRQRAPAKSRMRAVFLQASPMAPNATIVKIELQISDMDRHYYAAHQLTLAQHPSETPQRLMVRMLAFALNAHERLEFGPGLSSEDEPDIALRDYTGDIELWIDVGQPD